MKPRFCNLGLTNKCILKCRMCYKWQDVTVEEHPAIEQYKRFISDLEELSGKNVVVNFSGGEVLLFEGTIDLIKFSVEKGLLTHLASNGWLINEEMAKRIADSGLHDISLSLDSFEEEVHDYLRGGKGAYRKVMDAINYLHKYSKSLKINICCVIYDYNLDRLVALLEWVNNNKEINGISFLAPMQPDNTGALTQWWKGKFSYLWPKDYDKVCFLIDKLIESKKSQEKIGNSIAGLEEFKLYFSSPEKFEKKAHCNLTQRIDVNASGKVYLCAQMDFVGDIKDNISLKEILHSKKAEEVCRKMAVCPNNCHFLLNCSS